MKLIMGIFLLNLCILSKITFSGDELSILAKDEIKKLLENYGQEKVIYWINEINGSEGWQYPDLLKDIIELDLEFGREEVVYWIKAINSGEGWRIPDILRTILEARQDKAKEDFISDHLLLDIKDKVPNGELITNSMVRINHRLYEGTRAGTGFIVSDDMVLTAYHIATNDWDGYQEPRESLVVLKDGSTKKFSLNDVIRYKDTNIAVIRFNRGTFYKYSSNLDLIGTLDLNDENKKFFNPTFFPQEAMKYDWTLREFNNICYVLNDLLPPKVFKDKIDSFLKAMYPNGALVSKYTKYTNIYFAPYVIWKDKILIDGEEIKIFTEYQNQEWDAGSPLLDNKGRIIGFYSNDNRFMYPEKKQFICNNAYEVFDDDFKDFLENPFMFKEEFINKTFLNIHRQGSNIIVHANIIPDSKFNIITIISEVIRSYNKSSRPDLSETLRGNVIKIRNTYFYNEPVDIDKLKKDIEDKAYLAYRASLLKQ